MSNLRKLQLIAAAALFTVIGEASAQSAQVFAYPSGGQSQQQQDADRYACHTWSVSQTGFDPTAMPAPQAAPPPAAYASPPQQQSSGGFLGLGNGGMFKGGGMLGDAATGAALGAAGGALAGNAGKGAAIGALASTVLGVASKSSGSSQPPPPPANYNAYQQQAQMQTQDRQRRQADYNAAFGACMKARNYTVN
jgi:hypothetical protein